MRDVFKDPRTTTKTPVNDLAKLGIVVSKRTITRMVKGIPRKEERENFERRSQAVISKAGSGLSLCIPTRQRPKTSLVVKKYLQKIKLNTDWPAQI